MANKKAVSTDGLHNAVTVLSLEIKGRGKKTKVVMPSGTSQELAPNTLYSFGEVSALTVTLAAPLDGEASEYMFEFDSPSTATTLTVPSNVVWQDTLSVEASKHYEVSIRYDAKTQVYYGLIAEW